MDAGSVGDDEKDGLIRRWMETKLERLRKWI